MLTCYFREGTRYPHRTGIEACRALEPEAVIWIDLYNSQSEERAFVEERFAVELFTRQEAEEIETSSRYAESEEEINANVNYIYQKDEENFALDPVSFILTGKLLVTQRTIPLRSFDEVRRQLGLSRRPRLNAHLIWVLLMDARVDIEADFLEDISKKIYSTTRNLALEKDLDEEILIKIYHFQELNILIRESTSELKRLFSFILRSEFFPDSQKEKIRVLIKDADSLLNHTAFHFERLEYLQNTFMGLLDLEQNQIIKVFTLVTVIFTPPTLIASLYGMNFRFMPELDWPYGYPLALGLMVVTAGLTVWFFRRKRWL